ncbi:signal peptidase II [Arcobacter sp. FWKO B]|uniref:signal peptidase II n=1 Tax=Arcobacter sp. FWKO B TaxID=2593672 RepID=UPI0018A42CAE|nr:signal peptidase II [Arcobacter sp. FWKO B]QOG12143.1 lipoprotein signal peptidase [Arcobacter sp. FWKO B]
MSSKLKALIIFATVIVVDQFIKYLFVNGLNFESKCISFVLAYNTGVAFSMFAFLGEYLKYIQILLLVGISIYLYKDRQTLVTYLYPIALIFASGISNIFDRFIHIGVVDYVYWHCGFEFAIFNLADVMINVAVAWIFWIHFRVKDEG